MAKQKRSQTDATIRNVRASKRRDETLAARVKRLEAAGKETDRKIDELVHSLRSGLSRI
jgi:hypothetical protein